MKVSRSEWMVVAILAINLAIVGIVSDTPLLPLAGTVATYVLISVAVIYALRTMKGDTK